MAVRHYIIVSYFKEKTVMLEYTKEITIKLDKTLGYSYFIDYEHPLAGGNSGRVYLHRHIASITAGRWLGPDEAVHHKDHNKQNNDPTNLEVLSHAEHARLHVGPRAFIPVKEICPSCKEEYMKERNTQNYCSVSCAQLGSIKDTTLTKEILDPLIEKYSWIALGKMFGYSDNGIKKRARALGCTIPVRRK